MGAFPRCLSRWKQTGGCVFLRPNLHRVFHAVALAGYHDFEHQPLPVVFGAFNGIRVTAEFGFGDDQLDYRYQFSDPQIHRPAQSGLPSIARQQPLLSACFNTMNCVDMKTVAAINRQPMTLVLARCVSAFGLKRIMPAVGQDI